MMNLRFYMTWDESVSTENHGFGIKARKRQSQEHTKCHVYESIYSLLGQDSMIFQSTTDIYRKVEDTCLKCKKKKNKWIKSIDILHWT